MLRKEMLEKLGVRPHLLLQWQNAGILGKVIKNVDGKYVYSPTHLRRAEAHKKIRINARKGEWSDVDSD